MSERKPNPTEFARLEIARLCSMGVTGVRLPTATYEEIHRLFPETPVTGVFEIGGMRHYHDPDAKVLKFRDGDHWYSLTGLRKLWKQRMADV